MNIVVLVIGSVAGGLARYYLAGSAHRYYGTAFPYGTLVVNLIGCFLIGFFSSLVNEKFILGPQAKLLLMTGFCGAFTTFSTLMLETNNLLKDGEMFRAFANVFLSFIVGFVFFRIGILLGEIV